MDPSSSSQWASQRSEPASSSATSTFTPEEPFTSRSATPGPSSRNQNVNNVNNGESSEPTPVFGIEGETQGILTEQQTIVDDAGDELYYRTYRSEEEDLDGITRLVDQELSEPYVRPQTSIILCLPVRH